MDQAFDGLYYCGQAKNPVQLSITRLGSIEVDGLPQARLSIALGQTYLELIGDPAVTLQMRWSDQQGQQALLCPEPAFIAQLLTLNLAPSLREHLLKLQRQQRRNRAHEKHRVPFYLTMTAACLFAAYVVINLSAPLVADSIPYQWEQKIGKYALDNYKLGKEVIDDEKVNAAIDSIVQRIDQFDGADIKYQLSVVDAEMVNAFAFPGGYVVVTTGLIKQADAPEQVAAVLAHELTHVLQRHSMRKLVRQAGTGAILGIVFGDTSALSRLIELSTQLHGLAFDRDQERQADDGAVNILQQAGISPSHLAAFFEKIKQVDAATGSIPAMLRTHPVTEERIKRVASAEEPAQAFQFELDWPALQKRLENEH